MTLSQKAYGERLTDQEQDVVQRAFRHLSVQVLRYVRGGGDVRNMMEAITQAADIGNKLGDLSSGDVERYISDMTSWNAAPFQTTDFNTDEALGTMCSGALQLVASRISKSGQGNRETAGRYQLQDGAKQYVEARAQLILDRQKL